MTDDPIGALYRNTARQIVRGMYPERTVTDLEFDICEILHRHRDGMNPAEAVTEIAAFIDRQAAGKRLTTVSEICRYIKQDLANETVADDVYRKFTGKEP